MSKSFYWLIAAIILFLSSALPGGAQTSQAQHPPQARMRQEPCWQQVGISKEVIEQRDAVARDTRSQVESVCADTSLTPQQKKEKVHEIRQEGKQKTEGLIGQQQLEQLQACQKERMASHPSSAGAQHPGGGPCGEMTSPGGNHPSAGNSGEQNR